MHLLATRAVTLDEVDQAVDLGQTPAEVVVLSFSDSDLSAARRGLERNVGRLADVATREPEAAQAIRFRSISTSTAWRRTRAPSIVRCLGGLDYWRYGFERLVSAAREKGILLVALPGDDRPDPRLTALSTLEPEAVTLLDRVFPRRRTR